MDMTEFTLAKGQQVNADDLISGPRTITITGVRGNQGNKEQPVVVAFDGDEGKPFMPCKTMRRLMVAAWGADALSYVGRSMTLYRDPEVAFGGMKTGGVRISHMSHIDADMQVALTSSRGKRGMVKVKRMDIQQPKKSESTTQPKPTPATQSPSVDPVEMQRQMDAVSGDAAKKREWWSGLTDDEKAVVKGLAAEKEAGDE